MAARQEPIPKADVIALKHRLPDAYAPEGNKYVWSKSKAQPAPTPTSASQLAPEEIAAQQEMRGMLGAKSEAALPAKWWSIQRDGKVISSGSDVGLTANKLREMAQDLKGEIHFHDTKPASKIEVGPHFGMTWDQLSAKQQAAQQEMRGMLGGKKKAAKKQPAAPPVDKEASEAHAAAAYKFADEYPRNQAREDAEFYYKSVESDLKRRKMLHDRDAVLSEAEKLQLPDDRTYADVIRAGIDIPSGHEVFNKLNPEPRTIGDLLKGEKGKQAAEAEAAKAAASEKEQTGISALLKKQREGEASRSFDAQYKSLLRADPGNVDFLTSNVSPETARKVLDRLDAAPGDNPVLRSALNAKIEAKQGGLAGILKSEKGQIGSTETNPMVTGTRLAMGEAVEQSGKTVRKTMGPEGNDLIDRLTNVRNNAERNTGIQSQPLEDAIKGMKREHYENFVDVLEGKARPASQEVANAVSIADKVRKNIAQRAEAVDLQIKNPLTGEYTPFRPREDYFPHYSKEQFAKVVENPTARADIKAQIKDKLGPNATDKQAEDALQSMIKNSKRRDSHLEIARVIDLPDYHKDPRVFLKYINDANRRIAIANEFGPKLEKSEELLSAIGQNHGDKAESFARTLFNRELRMEEVPDTMAHRMMQGARNYEVLTKLGRAFIPNMSQHTYTAIVTNATDTAKGIAKAFTKEGRQFARRAGVVNDEVLKEFYNEVTGASTGDSLIHKAIGIELKPFTWSEKLNRVAAANAGRYYANETFDALQASPAKTKLRDTLSKMGIDVDAALKNGALSSTDELKAAQNIVNRSQFKVDPMELPLFWSSPEGKLLTQFKSFNFKSGQFMKDEILKEAAKGNIGPLARAAAILPPVGYTVSKIQNALRSGTQDDKNGIADYLATVGVLGIFSDLVRNGGRMDTSTIAGPTLSDVGKGLEAVSQTKQRLSDDYTGNAPAWGPLAKFAARQVPVVGSNLAAMFNEPKSERQQILDQLGIKDDHDNQRRKLIKQLGINR